MRARETIRSTWLICVSRSFAAPSGAANEIKDGGIFQLDRSIDRSICNQWNRKFLFFIRFQVVISNQCPKKVRWLLWLLINASFLSISPSRVGRVVNPLGHLLACSAFIKLSQKISSHILEACQKLQVSKFHKLLVKMWGLVTVTYKHGLCGVVEDAATS